MGLSKAEYKHDLLSDFKLPNKMPQIACSVDIVRYLG